MCQKKMQWFGLSNHFRLVFNYYSYTNIYFSNDVNGKINVEFLITEKKVCLDPEEESIDESELKEIIDLIKKNKS